MNRFYQAPFWKIFFGPSYSNLKYLGLIFVPHLLTSLFEGGSFAFIFLAFSAIEKSHSKDLGLFSFLDLKRWGYELSDIETFYAYILAAIAFQAFRGLITFLALYGTSLFSLKVQTKAQKEVYQQIFRFSFPFVSQYKTGDLSESAKSPSAFIPALFEAFNRFFVSLFMCLGLIGVLWWISPILTGLTILLFFIFALSQKKLIQKVLHYSKILTSHLFEFSHQTVQSLQGIRPIHIFQRQSYIIQKVDSVLDQVAQSSKKLHFWNNLIPTINETINVLLVGAILILGSFILNQSQEASLSNLLTYIALTYRLATRLQMLMASLGSVGLYYGSILQLNEILDDKDKEYDPPSGIEFKNWSQQIEFQEVSLRYPKSSKFALTRVSFSIPKGTVVGIVGLSGAGKSSILDLLLQLHNPTSGKILVDGAPLATYSHSSWRRKIGVVSQDPFIFNGTIEENIRFGDLESNMEDIRKAAEFAGILDFLDHLPQKFETVVGERGYKLSGGERQRIALARALLKDPEILVLDEATSNLDSHSEQLIKNSLDALQNSKTIIIVAHRLSTVMKADMILVLEKGSISERGKHQDLIRTGGRYAKLWELQSEAGVHV